MNAAPAGAGPGARGAFWAALSAYGLWGLLPAFLHLFHSLSPPLVTAWRIVWTVPAAGLAALALGGVASLRVPPRVVALLALSALLIAANWLIYVWAVGQNRIVESSLGYFINPLINVALGVALFGERMTRWQAAALGLAGLGVLNQTLLVGAFPWVALSLAATFAAYGLVRKLAPVAPAAGLAWESVILLAPAAGFLVWTALEGASLFGEGAHMPALIALLGPATALPLILFAAGARGLRLQTLGLLQYVAPSLQFATGLALGEPFTPGMAVTFTLIWAGLATYSFATWRAGRPADGTPPAV